MQDGSFGVERLSVAVGSCRLGVESLGDFVLGLGRGAMLCLENKDLVFVQSFLDDVEVGV